MKKVVIYSTPTCHFCAMAKEYFNQNNIAYESYDVLSDTARRSEMLDKSGQMGVPVIIIDDQIIVGFDKPKIAKALGLN